MEKLLDRLILFVCSCVFMMYNGIDTYTVVPLIIAISAVAINIAFDVPVVHISIFIIYLLLTIILPELVFFIPLMCYSLYCEPYKYVSLLMLIWFVIRYREYDLMIILWLFMLTALTFFLKKRTTELLSVRKDMYYITDELKEKTQVYNEKNRELLERQDYEITNATLNERNRIAREIHDNVGHLLSSSILQIGALMAITTDETQKVFLSQINDTLSKGMDSIRSSIHNIHEESMDLKLKIESMVQNFDFCPIEFVYNINEDFTMKQKYTIIYVIKEALANTMKHSDATQVRITIAELPGFYKIIIEDNGTKYIKKGKNYGGMGISGMCDRINSLDGNININNDNGYRIHISLPKLAKKKE